MDNKLITNKLELKKVLDREWSDRELYSEFTPGTIPGIDCWIFYDCYQSYLKYKHPVILFIPNDYQNPNVNDYFAIFVDKNPVILYEPKIWKIYESDIVNVLNFISERYKTLKAVADNKCSDADWIDFISPLNETFQKPRMDNLNPHETSLPHRIWIDPGSDRKHPNRIKIYVGNETISLYLHNLRFEGNTKLLSAKQKALYQKYVTQNRKFIDNFYKSNGTYNVNDLKADLYKLDKSGEFIEKNRLPADEFVVIRKTSGGKYDLAKRSGSEDNLTFMKDGKFAFTFEDGNPICFSSFSDNSYTKFIDVYTSAGESYTLFDDGHYIKRDI